MDWKTLIALASFLFALYDKVIAPWIKVKKERIAKQKGLAQTNDIGTLPPRKRRYKRKR